MAPCPSLQYLVNRPRPHTVTPPLVGSKRMGGREVTGGGRRVSLGRPLVECSFEPLRRTSLITGTLYLVSSPFFLVLTLAPVCSDPGIWVCLLKFFKYQLFRINLQLLNMILLFQQTSPRVVTLLWFQTRRTP